MNEQRLLNNQSEDIRNRRLDEENGKGGYKDWNGFKQPRREHLEDDHWTKTTEKEGTKTAKTDDLKKATEMRDTTVEALSNNQSDRDLLKL